MKTFLQRGASVPFRPRRSFRTPIATAVAAALLKQSMVVYAADVTADQPTTAAQPKTTAQAAESREAELQEVVVTATRRSLNIQSVPYNLAAVTSGMMQEAQMVKIQDALAYLPGVSAYGVQNDTGFQNIITRGLNLSQLSPTGATSIGDAGEVAIYFGEVPLFYGFKLLDIDRVEALLGPQGTLYGTGTLGGVIRYVPKDPDLSNFEADMHLRGTAQEHATPYAGYDVDAVLNVPLIDGVLALRAVVGDFHEPGFMDDTRLVRVPGVSLPQPNFNNPSAVAANLYTEKGVNFDHTVTARAELLYKPADSFQAELTYMHQRLNSDGNNGDVTVPPPVGTGPYSEGFRVLGVNAEEVDLSSLVLTEHLSFADLTSASSYTRERLASTQDTTDLFLSAPTYTNFPQFVAYQSAVSVNETYAEELRLVSNGQSRLNWIVGGFYEYANSPLNDSQGYQYTPGYPAYLGLGADHTDIDSYFANGGTSSDKAVFGELGYQFTNAWQVLIGTRWFKDASNTTEESSQPLFGVPLTSVHLTGPSVATSLYKFNTSYRFTPDLMVYATVDDGYRAGGLNGTLPCPPGVTHDAIGCLQPNQLVWKPDRTRNYEVGIRSTWFDKRLVLNGDVYYIKWRDLRVTCVNFNVTYLCNGGGAVSKGLETSFQAQLPFHLSLFGNYTHSEAYLTVALADQVSNLSGENFSAEPGDRLPGTPRDYGAMHLRYSGNLPDNYSYYATYGIKAQSNIYNNFGGTLGGGEITGGYAVQDASLGLSKNNWDVSFFVENLTDKYAWTSSTGNYGYAGYVAPNGFIYRGYFHSVLPPRTFGLEYTAHFGPHH
jgi:iron complex outermembrane recepter protein